jgi:hypothetical protein
LIHCSGNCIRAQLYYGMPRRRRDITNRPARMFADIVRDSLRPVLYGVRYAELMASDWKRQSTSVLPAPTAGPSVQRRSLTRSARYGHWLARHPVTPEVAGSSPVGPANLDLSPAGTSAAFVLSGPRLPTPHGHSGTTTPPASSRTILPSTSFITGLAFRM